MKTISSIIIRLVLLVAGLLFAASLLVAALLLAAVWGLRWVWARLTGRPATPWVVRFNPLAGFEPFRQAARKRQGPSAADVVNARSRGEAANSPISAGQTGEVTDVDARPVSRTG